MELTPATRETRGRDFSGVLSALGYVAIALVAIVIAVPAAVATARLTHSLNDE